MSGGDAMLQVCRGCGATLYPRRELCAFCLSDDLQDRDAAGLSARVIAITTLHATLEASLRPMLPLRIGAAVLPEGTKLIAYTAPHIDAGDDVILSVVRDPGGRAVLVASETKLPAIDLVDVLRGSVIE